MSAFIKRYASKNGGTVVQVVFKRGRRVERTVHIGTAHTQGHLETLLALAADTIHEGQSALDLFEEGPAGPTLTLENTYSGVLWGSLCHVFDRLGFDRVGDDVFKQLVLARVIEPVSKLDTIRVLSGLGLDAPSYSRINRTLDRVVREGYRDVLSDLCFRNASSASLSLVLHDVTTLYFEIQREDEYRKPGLSKERRLEPQITLGLLVDRNGFPLELRSFEGNRAETKTIVPVLRSFSERHGLKDITVVADAAMLSGGNLTALEELGYRYIVGSRLAKTPYEIAEYLEVSPEEVLEALETAEAYNFVSLETDRNSDGSDSFSILEYVGEDDQLMALVDDRTTLSEGLKHLTPLEQRVLYLRFFQGLTQTEIATTLGISQMQVSRLLRKTLRALREHIVIEEA